MSRILSFMCYQKLLYYLINVLYIVLLDYYYYSKLNIPPNCLSFTIAGGIAQKLEKNKHPYVSIRIIENNNLRKRISNTDKRDT